MKPFVDDILQISPNAEMKAATSVAIPAISSTSTQNDEKKKTNLKEDSKIAETFQSSRNAVESNTFNSDMCDTYGQHVAHKLKAYSQKTQNIVQHHFNTILFNADMGAYDNVDPRCALKSTTSLLQLFPTSSSAIQSIPLSSVPSPLSHSNIE